MVRILKLRCRDPQTAKLVRFFKFGCRDPWTAESVRILKLRFRDQWTVKLDCILKFGFRDPWTVKSLRILKLICRGGQNSSRLKSGPDYLVFLSRFFSGNCLVQTKSRFESGFNLDKFYFYFEIMSRLCPDSNLDFVWTRQFPEKN